MLALLALALTAGACIAALVAGRSTPPASASPSVSPSAAAVTDGDGAPLFPGIDESAALELLIATGDRRFEFRRSGGSVSVNGHMADSEIFSTLLDQVIRMPVVPREAFSAHDAPVMTISILCEGAPYSVRFYQAQEEGMADVLFMQRSCEQYGVTDAWRLGTLLLTCDGTRIIDEHGGEAPAR